MIANRPKIGIFTPIHRTHRFIEYTIDSVLQQTYQNWEWVILDNSVEGEDVTKWFWNHVIEKYPFAYYMFKSKIRIHKVMSESRNLGYLKSVAAGLVGECDVLFEQEADDILLVNALETLAQAIEAHPNCKFFWSDNIMLDHWENNGIKSCSSRRGAIFTGVAKVRFPEIPIEIPCNVAQLRNIDYVNIVEYNNMPLHWRAWKRDFYHLLGGFDSNVRFNEDQDLLCRTFLHCKKNEMCRIAHPGSIWNGHGSNTGGEINGSKEITAGIFDTYRERLKEHFELEKANEGFIIHFYPHLENNDIGV